MFQVGLHSVFLIVVQPAVPKSCGQKEGKEEISGDVKAQSGEVGNWVPVPAH